MNKVPNLRFQEFSGEWEHKLLSSFATKITQKNGDYKVTNVISNSAKNGLVSQKDYFDKDIANQDNINGYYVINNGDFVYNPRKSNESPYGPINRFSSTEAGVVSPLYLCFSVNCEVNDRYLEYYFKSSKWYQFIYRNSDQGARHDRVSIRDAEFFKMKLNIPNYREQEKIASFFSLIDKKIELQTEKVEELKNYKKGIMQKIFSQELRFKDENGNEYPEWEKRRLQTIVEKKIKGKNPLYSETGNVLLNNEFMENNTEPLFVENEIDVTKKDILILWDGSQAGKVYTGFEGVLGSTFVAITLNKNNCNIFIQEQLEYNLNKIQRAWREGSGVPHVAKDFIENYKIFVPCYEEQSKISKMLLNINEKIKLEEKKLQYIKELKKGLLQQMFI